MQILTQTLLSTLLLAAQQSSSASTKRDAAILEPLVVDEYKDISLNSLGKVHGGSASIVVDPSIGAIVVNTRQIDDFFFSNFGDGCNDMRNYKTHFIHLELDGSSEFSITVHEHNDQCDEKIRPYPATWDSVDASRYTQVSGGDRFHIWVPFWHFSVNQAALTGITFEGFWGNVPTRIYKTELVTFVAVPSDYTVPVKAETGTLFQKCKDPNTFAFGIDDGIPRLAHKTLQILKDEDVKITFFVVGKPLGDDATGFADFYKEAIAQGHEIGSHSWDHPQVEALPTVSAIDEQFRKSLDIIHEKLGVAPALFRPPYGTLGARSRAAFMRNVAPETRINAAIVKWSVDVEDWIYGPAMPSEFDLALDQKPGTQEEKIERWRGQKQLGAFKRDVALGGNLVVAHYLYDSTVEVLGEMIRHVKERGGKIVTVSECIRGGN